MAGQLDDALLVAFVLRRGLREVPVDALRRHWPGPGESLSIVLRLG